jgi:hypothetical protein
MREPLLHFLLIGLLLFVLYGAVGKDSGNRQIRVDDNVVAALQGQFRSTLQRPPTPAEMNALVDSYVREQIFYREGVALGLDRDDPTITRRVGQKFATIAEESEAAGSPSETDLQDWLNRHPGRYAEPPLVTFDQIAFEQQSDGEALAAAIESARKDLVAGADPQTLGSGRVLLPHYQLYPLDLVGREFGTDFARALPSLPKDRWAGPIRSGYGLHLVRVEDVVPGKIPRLKDVRTAVARDVEEDRRGKSLETAYRKLRKSYRVEYAGAWKPAARQ